MLRSLVTTVYTKIIKFKPFTCGNMASFEKTNCLVPDTQNPLVNASSLNVKVSLSTLHVRKTPSRPGDHRLKPPAELLNFHPISTQRKLPFFLPALITISKFVSKWFWTWRTNRLCSGTISHLLRNHFSPPPPANWVLIIFGCQMHWITDYMQRFAVRWRTSDFF